MQLTIPLYYENQKNNSFLNEKSMIIIYQRCDSFWGFSAILTVYQSDKTAKIFHRYSLSRELFERVNIA